MTSLRQRLAPSAIAVIGMTLTACAGVPVSTELRPLPAALRSTSGVGITADFTPAVPSVRRGEFAPAEAKMYSSLEEMLNGRIAGLELLRRNDGTFSVRVRGGRSFSADAEPLIVVDGMHYGNTAASDVLSTLSPQDVKRVDVLKDAGATAQYGSRGSNGVVLITTRRRG
ncbi:MAG: TonB-dependent receptor plug domain-containing protein [Gemmatimonadaceae bacterium]